MTGGFAELTPEDPQRVGPFRIVARLGSGGMGRVYLGRSRGGRPVAVKVVRPELAEDEEFRRRFAREVAAARQVNGVFTAGVVDADPDGSPAWLATAYVRGVSLDAAVAEHGAFPEGPVLTMGAGLAEALEAIHAVGVVHRDLKPSNVLLAADGPRVIDFGISVVDEVSSVTRTGMMVGTPGFMSPEQLTGRPVGAPSDVFSLGAVLVFAATGVGPFGVGSTHGVLFRTVYEEPDLSALPAGLVEVTRRCLAKDPAGRPGVDALMDEFARRVGDGRTVTELLSDGGWLPQAVARTLTRTPTPPSLMAQQLDTPAREPRADAASGRAGDATPTPGDTTPPPGDTTPPPRDTTSPPGGAAPPPFAAPPPVDPRGTGPVGSPPPSPGPAGASDTPLPGATPRPHATPRPDVTPSPDTTPSPDAAPLLDAAPPPDTAGPPGVDAAAFPAFGPPVSLPAGTPGIPSSAPRPMVTSLPEPFRPGPARPRTVARRVLIPLGALVTVAAISVAIVWSGRGGGSGSSGLPTPPTRQTGDSGKEAGQGAGTGTGAGKRTTTVTIGVSVPLTGDLAAYGQGIKNSVDLAVKEANRKKSVPGVTFAIKALDDKAQPSTGQQNATALVADERVVGVVGPLNSSVAQSSQPVFGEANLAQVSPAATNPLLTQGEEWVAGAKKRPYASFFRTATTDDHQGSYAARYLYRKLTRPKVFLIDDGKTYGAGLVQTFEDRFRALGGDIVGRDRITPGDRDFAELVAKVKGSGAEAVYYGGEYPEAGPLSQQLKKAGFDKPLVGGDGLYSDEYIKLAGSDSDGDLSTTAGVPAERLDTARQFVRMYADGDYAYPYGAYGGYAYDATWAIIQAVKAVAEDHKGRLPAKPRPAVVKALQDVSFFGVTGEVAFDAYGDTTDPRLSVNRVQDGKWTLVDSGRDED
ncbi:ABC transporter substrate-binding protein [Streptomyces sp. LX-29]|uniref:ABC transporter substrate-binding protein n=1 Tax=Streptomyces sp. LX-29 TaxID=2900152 RepID=UPI00240CED27|nr:ABC transporter substrate-binding protein [Streptomyces sp. LX-29]WFB05991.1 ABC transporter substrate-binding protein [Streptomyces sp. LX-29]